MQSVGQGGDVVDVSGISSDIHPGDLSAKSLFSGVNGEGRGIARIAKDRRD